MSKLIGYARLFTRDQSTGRQVADLHFDRGASGALASRPAFDKALDALIVGDTLVITTLDRLGRSTQNMFSFGQHLRDLGAELRVLNLGGRPRRITDTQINAIRLVDSGEPAAQVARHLGMSRATFYRRARAITD